VSEPTIAQTSDHLDNARLAIGKSTGREHKSALGQFLTPYPIAQFMAPFSTQKRLNLC